MKEIKKETMWYEVGGYDQKVTDKEITCTCIFGSLYPYNYKDGKNICKHIKELLKILKNELRENERDKKREM